MKQRKPRITIKRQEKRAYYTNNKENQESQ